MRADRENTGSRFKSARSPEPSAIVGHTHWVFRSATCVGRFDQQPWWGRSWANPNAQGEGSNLARSEHDRQGCSYLISCDPALVGPAPGPLPLSLPPR